MAMLSGPKLRRRRADRSDTLRLPPVSATLAAGPSMLERVTMLTTPATAFEP